MTPSLTEVARLVAELPEEARRELARGPLAEPMCRLCSVLRNDCEAADGRVVDALWNEWHEEHEAIIARGWTGAFPDGELTDAAVDRMRAMRDALGDDAYRSARTPMEALQALAGGLSFYRCIVVYLLAGWRPDGVMELS